MNEIERQLESDILFVQEGVMDHPNMDTITIIYDLQFVDEMGNIYPIEEGIDKQSACSHTYVEGTYYIHEKYADGSCYITYYKAQRCTNCGYVIPGDLINTLTYGTCIL